MSGILGIWNVDGEPVASELLLRMNERLAHRGPDGANHLLCGSAGFAFQQSKVTPESFHEVQPLQSAGVVALFDGRLDNREELIEVLKQGIAVDRNSTDVSLVLAAYEIFRADFTTRLAGDFAIAVFDGHRKQLFLARDAMGARVLHYCRFGQHVLFASEIKALLAHPAVESKLNEESLAEFLFSEWNHRDETNTMFTGVFGVPPASLVTMTPERTTISRYFDLDTTKTLRLRDQSEYIEAYREAFSRAVRRRLRSSYPVAVSVSGGLDSSSIYCMANAIRISDPADVASIIGVGMVFDDHSKAKIKAGELEFQKAVQDHCGQEMLWISMTDLTSGSDRGHNVWHVESPWVIDKGFEELFRRSSEKGARVLLSGVFGDNLLMSPQFLLDLTLARMWPMARDAYHGFMTKPWFLWEDDGDNASKLHAYLFREIRSFLLPEALRPLYRKLRYKWFRRRLPVTFFSQRFLKAARAAVASSNIVQCRPGRAHCKALYLAARSKTFTSRIEMEAKTAYRSSLDLTYPYRDRELVQLVMSMPGEVVYPGGDSRGIHREAMKEILPESVRLRRTKADFTRVTRQAALEDAAVGLQALRTGYAMARGLLKPAVELDLELTDLQQALAEGDDIPKDMYDMALNLLALEDFVAVFYGLQRQL